jgi:hypothetical protein
MALRAILGLATDSPGRDANTTCREPPSQAAGAGPGHGHGPDRSAAGARSRGAFLGGPCWPRVKRPAPAGAAARPYTQRVSTRRKRTSRADPFAALELPAQPDLTDDDVRSAWRRIAAATHPDRDDGGDPARFAAAAAAYTTLRTHFGRGEALADLAGPRRRHSPILPVPRWAARARPAGQFWSRVRRGRPGRLALRIAAAAAVSVIAVLVAGAQPATPALITGALTWLSLTARHDLAAPDTRTQPAK